MKRSLILFICLMLLTRFVTAQPTTPEERHLRDSIFQVCHSMDTSEDRMHYLRGAFFANIDKRWAVELLDSALAISIKNKNTDAELIFRVSYYQHYKYLSDLPKMEESFKALREFCQRTKSYQYYFQTWCDILQFYNVRGDTEHARMQALQMEEEAKQLKDEEGLAYAHLSLARSLASSKKELEAIRIYKEVLKSKILKPMTRVMIHGEIISAYQEIGKYEETVKELHIQNKILKDFINEDPSYADLYKENQMEVELCFCNAYDKLNDADNLLKHLKEAQKFYSPDCFFSNYINYHAYWGAYYRLTRQWEDCFREFDTALAHFDNTQPLTKKFVLRMKGTALIEAGRYGEAAQLYKDLSILGDSLNYDVMKLHQEALLSNYNIRKALLDKEKSEIQYNWIIATFVIILVFIVALTVYRTRKVHLSLRRAERETRQALEIVDAENKMKEVFLRNITHQIRGPLNVVVGFSEILATEKDLDPEQTQEYSVSIKKNADLLFQLIIDVLDLSRLESGMMKFNVSECDAAGMCRDAKMAVEMQDGNKVELSFETTVDELNIEADSGRFLKMLLSVLSAPSDYEQMLSVKYTLSQEDTQLKIVVGNSPLHLLPENMQRIKHDINRLYLKAFKGTYQVTSTQDRSDIIITYPLG